MGNSEVLSQGVAGGGRIFVLLVTILVTARCSSAVVLVFSPASEPGVIRGNISNASIAELLSVRLESGDYSRPQAVALVSTRMRMISISSLGNATLDCSEGAGSDSSGYIEIANSSGYSFGESAGGSILTLLSCPLVFRNPSGQLHLSHVQVTRGNYSQQGVSAAVAIVGAAPEGSVAADIWLRSCVFSKNSATPLLVEAAGACVRVESCRFAYNTVVINDYAAAAINASFLPRAASGGLAVGAVEPSGGQATCSAAEQLVLVSNTTFVNNTLRATITQSVALSVAVIAGLNAGEHACGAGAYVYMSGAAAAASSPAGQTLRIADGTLFENGRANDISPVIAAGGGLCVHYLVGAENWAVALQDVNFTHNHAERSGGVHVMFNENAVSNTFACLNGTLQRNRASPHDKHSFYQSRGGAVSVDMSRNCNNNSATFGATDFTENRASEGGGLHVNYRSAEKQNYVQVESGSVFYNNSGVSGAAIYSVASRQQGINSVPRPEGSGIIIEIFPFCTRIRDTLFLSNEAFTSGTVSINFAHVVVEGNVNFTDNRNSAVSLVNTNMYVSNDTQLTFERNIGGLGGAVYLSDSEVVTYERVRILFKGNIAQTTGGAIHANMHTRSVGLVASELTPHCFITFYEVGVSMLDWTCNVSFYDNMAGQAGAGIFAPDFTPCLFLASYDEKENIDPEWTVIFKEAWDVHFFGNGTFGNVVNEALVLGSPYAGPIGGSSEGIPSVNNAWSRRWLPTVSYAILDEDPDFHKGSVPNTLSTDVVDVAWKTTESCPDPPVHSPEDDGEVTISCNVSSEEYFRLKGVATDQFGQQRDALFLVLPKSEDDGYSSGNSENTSIKSSPYLRLKNGATSDLAVAGTPRTNASFSISVVGTARLVVHTLHLTFVECRHGFYSRKTRQDNETGLWLHSCGCGKTADHVYVQLCEKNRFAFLYIGLWGGDDRDPECNNKITSPECRENANKKFDVTICPVGYCKTLSSPDPCHSSVDGVGCLYNYDDQDAICANNRSGRLCAKCPKGKTRSMTVESGECSDCHAHSLWFVIPFVLAVPVLVLIALVLNIPLSNDLRGLFFAAAVTRSIICPEDQALLDYPQFNTFLGIGEIVWPSASCIIPGITSLDAIALGYAAPAGAVLVALFLHLLPRARCCSCLRNWLGRTDQNTMKHGTWLVIFYCFQKALQSSIKFLICVPLFDKNRFFYDADVTCYTEAPHAYYVYPALVIIAGLCVLMVICFFMAKDWNILCIKANLFVGSILRRGLKSEYCWWAVWDLGRRMMIFFGTMLVVKGCENRQIYMLCCVAFIFAAHLVAMPYVTPHEYDTRFRLVTWSTPPFLRSGESCNRLEGVVLFNMLLLSGFSLIYRHVDAESATQYILIVLAVWPVGLFFLLVIYKVVALLVLRFNCECLFRFFEPNSDSLPDEQPLVIGGGGGGDGNIVDGGGGGGRSHPRKALRDGILAVPLLEHSPHGNYSTMRDFGEDTRSV